MSHEPNSHDPLLDVDGPSGGAAAHNELPRNGQGEVALRELAAIVESSRDAILSADINGIVTSWNRAAQLLFGYEPDEIIGRPISLLMPPDVASRYARWREISPDTAQEEGRETVGRKRDGTSLDLLATASTLKDDLGNVVGLSFIAHDVTERTAVRRDLEAAGRRLEEAQRTANMGSFEYEIRSGSITWSNEICRILGLPMTAERSPDVLVRMTHPDDLELCTSAWDESLRRRSPLDLYFRMIRTDSAERWIHLRTSPEVGSDGRVVKVLGTLMDTTQRVEAERIRREAEIGFRTFFEQSDIGAAIVALNGRATQVNSAMCRIMGRPPEELIGHSWNRYLHPDEGEVTTEVAEHFATGHDSYTVECRYLHGDGHCVWVSAHVALIRNADGSQEYCAVQFEDITDRKTMQSELARQALYDSLTGLPNRVLLADRLAQGLAGSRRRGSHLGVMFLDIDRFKMVNDSFGHNTGDQVLKLAALRIGEAIRPGDTVARLGGDEFVVVCDDVSVVEAEQIAQRVLAALNEPWRIDDQEMLVHASIGIAIGDTDATPESLLRDSDTAMYRAKRNGRGRIELFDDTLRRHSERRFSTASALHGALERNEFRVAYQPVVDLGTGRLVSVEALLRWDPPGRDPISPTEFIPIAEETGLIETIGAWVLRESCRQLVQWQQIQAGRGQKPLVTIAVNMSVRQLLSPEITQLVCGVLSDTGLQAGHLCLELTESLFMEDVDYFSQTLSQLKTTGVRLAIDDFGTGYSSLSYLKRFPVDSVKIDRAFVDGLGTDPHDTALVAAIVAMAGALDLDIVAEGIENREQLVGLKALRVPHAQGFLLAHPMCPDEVTRLITTDHRWDVTGTSHAEL